MNIIVVTKNKQIKSCIAKLRDFKVIAIDFKILDRSLEKVQNNLLDVRGIINKEEFDREYVDFIGSLNSLDKERYWWADSVSEKNELLSKLYQRLFYAYVVHICIQKEKTKNLVIFCSDYELVHHFEILYKSHQIPSAGFFIIRKKIRNFLRYIIKNFLVFKRELQRINLIGKHLHGRKKEIQNKESFYIVKTIIDKRNYKSGVYVDSYFGKCINFLKKRVDKLLLFADIVQDYETNIVRLANEKDYSILPLEAYMEKKDIVKTIWDAFRNRNRFFNKIFFKELDVSWLIKSELEECFFSGKFLENLLYYTKTLKFLNSVNCECYLYTFENYAWEKMGLLAAKVDGKKVKTVGFQHAFISRNSFRYFPSRKESVIMPLPDKLISIGKVTKDILKKYGEFHLTDIVEGCALRQEKTISLKRIDIKEKRDIFVPLTITIDDTVKFLNFLYEAGLQNYKGKIFLRFHPLTKKNKVFSSLNFSLPENFVVSENVTLQEEFIRCGIVLYSWTTVCIEALMVGLPAIHLDINYPLYVDPLFNCQHLKRTVSNPKDLMQIIEDMLNQGKEKHDEEYKSAHLYVEKYFYPVTKQNMKCFLN